jgi:hypothetical protein
VLNIYAVSEDSEADWTQHQSLKVVIHTESLVWQVEVQKGGCYHAG